MLAIEILAWGFLILIILNLVGLLFSGIKIPELTEVQKIEKDIIARGGTRVGLKTLSKEEKKIFRVVKWREAKPSLLILLAMTIIAILLQVT